jgi:hypothetical protein
MGSPICSTAGGPLFFPFRIPTLPMPLRTPLACPFYLPFIGHPFVKTFFRVIHVD